MLKSEMVVLFSMKHNLYDPILQILFKCIDKASDCYGGHCTIHKYRCYTHLTFKYTFSI